VTLVNGGYEATNPLVSFTTGTRTERLTAARDAAKAIMDGTYGTFALVGSTADPVLPMTEAQVQGNFRDLLQHFQPERQVEQ
jgi:starch-binding outer membrane protein, SusD/RagB family